MNPTRMQEELLLLDLKKVCAILGLSRSTVYRLEAAGNFPKRIHLSERRVAWRAQDVSAFINRQNERVPNGN